MTEPDQTTSLKVTVFRLEHRPVRDKRVTTHLFLAARALGAEAGVYSGTRDRSVEEALVEVCRAWGGSFELEYTGDYKAFIIDWKRQSGKVLHLTMYGMPLRETISEIRSDPAEKLVVVGGEKVPREVYDLADWNVSISSQPHSEVSALGIFLHELFQGREFCKEFEGARLRIIPQRKGKRVVYSDTGTRNEKPE